jgi:hypothetical protein
MDLNTKNEILCIKELEKNKINELLDLEKNSTTNIAKSKD